MARRKKSLQTISWMALVSFAVTPAVAEAAAADSAPVAFGLEEVIVTARKRNENIRDIPDTIQAISAETLERADVRSVTDIKQLVSNFQVVEAQQPGVVLINIRGIGQTRNGEPPIAVVVDGVQQNSPNQITQGLFDIERIEVLKGPQGALYGRNALGGAINITTKAPGDDLALLAELGYAEGKEFIARGSVSGPLVADKVGFRISGSYKDREGQIDNITVGEKVDFDKTKAIRGTLVFTPNENLSIDLRGSYYDQRAGAAWYRSGPVNASRDPVVANILGHGDRELADLSAKINYDMGAVSLSSVSSYSSIKSFLYEDLDYEALDLVRASQRMNVKAYSQELRLASSDQDARLSWMVGAYYLHTDRDIDTILYAGTDLTALPMPILLAMASASGKNAAYAAFGQAIYNVTDAWRLTLGLRYDIDDRDMRDQAPVVPTAQVDFDTKFKSLQPKISLSYSFEDKSLAYATIAKGFRSGGFNDNDVVTRLYKKEQVWSYEAGFKAILANNLVNVNGAVYYMDIKDRQVAGLDLSTGPAQFIANPIPKSHVIGVELELLARPMEGLDVTVGGGLQTSKIDEYDQSVFANTLANGNYKGNKLNQMPGYTLNAAVQYTYPIASGNLISRVDVSGSGGAYYWEINNVDHRKEVWTVDLRLAYENGPYSITGFVRNLFDKRYDLEFVPAVFSGVATGQDLGAASPPRQFGVIGKVSF
ncbi:TonB-dependent receptor [Govanella unica]|uniref:TonB-dependent receptor n=1 Tax=Govanella unica TaxID=2975056 RepID=A0A9X3TYS1_9PROT|nr:TonB-dependent receptor [Govania unica]MDA5194219.1 TonB-dependent receptor [Govania unica]